MEILQAELKWGDRLYPLTGKVRYIILHHAAGHGSVRAVHAYHRDVNGWSGIAYHLYIRRSGEVWAGRPLEMKGAHCLGYNGCSIGVCFEGDFEKEVMPPEQLEAGREAVEYLRKRFPGARVLGHRELSKTACPGANFPLEELKGARDMSGEEIYRALCEYLADKPCPEWAAKELEEAKALGITDGGHPMQPTPRYQAAIMAKRAAVSAMNMGRGE